MDTSQSPVVSIIIPYYNQGDFVEDAIDSALNQTYPNIEIILVNDGSDDPPSLFVLERCKKKYDGKVVFIDQPNGKLPNARNTGIKRSKGKYICCLDADDILDKTYIEKTVPPLESDPSLGFCGSWTQLFGKQLGIRKNFPINIATCLAENTNVASALFRRSLWEKVGGYDESMNHGYEDWDLWISFAELGCGSHIIPEPLFFYRIREGSMISLADEKRLENMAYLFRKHQNTAKKYFSDIALCIENQLISCQKDQIGKQSTINILSKKVSEIEKKCQIEKTKIEIENQDIQAEINALTLINEKNRQMINKIIYSKFFKFWQVYARLKKVLYVI